METVGLSPERYSVSRDSPMAKGVNRTGIVGETWFPAASWSEPLNRSVRPGLPSLKMTMPDAPAACALSALVPKVHVPRWTSATWPGTKPVKSAAVHPRAEVGVAVGGMTIPAAGWTEAEATVPAAAPAVKSVSRVNVRAVGATSLKVGFAVKAKYGKVYFWMVTLYPAACIFAPT